MLLALPSFTPAPGVHVLRRPARSRVVAILDRGQRRFEHRPVLGSEQRVGVVQLVEIGTEIMVFVLAGLVFDVEIGVRAQGRVGRRIARARGGQVGVRAIAGRAGHDERHVDVGVVGRHLAGHEAMLAHVIARCPSRIRGRCCPPARWLHRRLQGTDHLVHRQHGLSPQAEVAIHRVLVGCAERLLVALVDSHFKRHFSLSPNRICTCPVTEIT